MLHLSRTLSSFSLWLTKLSCGKPRLVAAIPKLGKDQLAAAPISCPGGRPWLNWMMNEGPPPPPPPVVCGLRPCAAGRDRGEAWKRMRLCSRFHAPAKSDFDFLCGVLWNCVPKRTDKHTILQRIMTRGKLSGCKIAGCRTGPFCGSPSRRYNWWLSFPLLNETNSD